MKNWKKAMSIAAAAAMATSVFAIPVQAEDETFKIGGIGPMTGAAAVYGNAVMNSIQIAVDEINEAGGINGFQVEFNPQDDEHDAEKSVNAYNTLKDWGMDILLGTVTSAPCIAVEAEAANDNMFLLTPSATAIESISGDNAFRVCFADPAQGTASAKYIGENKLAEKVAVIYDSSDVYSSGIYGAFQAEAANQPFEIVAAEAFTADSKTDFSVQLQKAKDSGADMVFVPFYYNEIALVLKQASDMGFAPKWFGVDGMDGILTLDGFDTKLAEGVILLTPFNADSEDEATVKFVATYKDKYGEVPNQFAADAYDSVWAIYNAIKDEDVSAKTSASDFCDLLMEKFTSEDFSYDGITGDGMTWDDTGAVTKAPKGMVIKDGAYVGLD